MKCFVCTKSDPKSLPANTWEWCTMISIYDYFDSTVVNTTQHTTTEYFCHCIDCIYRLCHCIGCIYRLCQWIGYILVLFSAPLAVSTIQSNMLFIGCMFLKKKNKKKSALLCVCKLQKISEHSHWYLYAERPSTVYSKIDISQWPHGLEKCGQLNSGVHWGLENCRFESVIF